MTNKFNQKITFKFIENIWQERDHRESENAIKMIYKKTALPHSFTEIMFSKSLKAYEMIVKSKDIDQQLIYSILKIYKPTIELLNDELNCFEPIIIEIKNMNLESESWIDSFVKIFKLSVLIQCFRGYEIEMAKLLSNYRLIKANDRPIIMYCYSSQKMANIARTNGDYEKMKKIFKFLIKRTNKFNQCHDLIELDDIKKILMDLKNDLMTKFGITYLGIFGSYSRGEQNEYSDLDILCKVRDDFKNISNLKDEIASFIKDAVSIDVDVMIDDVTYDADQIPVDMFTEKIQIF